MIHEMRLALTNLEDTNTRLGAVTWRPAIILYCPCGWVEFDPKPRDVTPLFEAHKAATA